MLLKRILLALASAVVAMTISGTAMAGTWTATSGAPTFATEIFGTGGDATVLTIADTAAYTIAAAPGDGAAFNITYTLTGATWGATLASSALNYTTMGSLTIVKSSAGTTSDSTVVFRVDVSDSLAANTTFDLTYSIMSAATALTNSGGTVKLAVTLIDGLGNVDTAGVATTIATSLPGTTLSVLAATSPSNIDVTGGGVKFADGSQQILLGTIGLVDNSSTVNTVNPTGANIYQSDGTTQWVSGAGDAVITAWNLTLTGGFAAAVSTDKDSDSATKDGIFIDLDSGASFTALEQAATLTATSTTFALTAANLGSVRTLGVAAATDTGIYMVTDGTTDIEVTTPTITSVLNYSTATITDDSSITGSALAVIVKNGSSGRVEFALTPGGAFSNWVRITNPSSTDGDVFLTIIDDAGNTSKISLGDIAGQSTNELKARASTGLIKIQDIFDATTGLSVANSGKLRIELEAEFGANNLNPSTSVYATTVTTSTDGTTFATFR